MPPLLDSPAYLMFLRQVLPEMLDEEQVSQPLRSFSLFPEYDGACGCSHSAALPKEGIKSGGDQWRECRTTITRTTTGSTQYYGQEYLKTKLRRDRHCPNSGSV
ncbi:hypothetical protein AVEN_179023-1 [Araneus ventricosus]|uniref:Uncharacterized protein n=1 Tax=Araneus ventricosus TaxID=182803 RepID=A0A4Y2JRF4_ARAVE|nr:hypothetical protein AVEN_179023-1 [Araneus ventricosus]